ncbi:hypothetical protein [Teredinibacter turnerae]|uniref:hypothetical protein n=1 Tax=Teredinibacter turnerae TaxID=2426 RepID=UPI0030CAA10C
MRAWRDFARQYQKWNHVGYHDESVPLRYGLYPWCSSVRAFALQLHGAYRMQLNGFVG